jgi:oligopeptide transport system permease protein
MVCSRRFGMSLVRELLKTFLIYLLVLAALILVVLFPREMVAVSNNHTIEFQFQFTWTDYMGNISQFFTGVWENKSLGTTLSTNDITVEKEVSRYLPRSLVVIFTSFLISIPFGVLKGIFDYRNFHNKKKIFGQGLTSFFLAVPDFFLIICLQWIILYYLPFIQFFGHEHWYSFMLSSMLVSIYPTMYIARITSSSLAAQEGQPYIQVAKAKGFGESIVLYKHILRNCWGTILSHCSTVMLYILSNLLIVEYLMDYKGAAYRLFKAFNFTNSYSTGYASQFEGELVIGLGISFMFIVLLTQWVSQVAKHYADPR